MAERRKPKRGVRPVDVAHELVGHQALVVDVHAQVVRDVLAARVVEGLAGGPVALRRAIGLQVAIAAGAAMGAADRNLPRDVPSCHLTPAFYLTAPEWRSGRTSSMA